MSISTPDVSPKPTPLLNIVTWISNQNIPRNSAKTEFLISRHTPDPDPNLLQPVAAISLLTDGAHCFLSLETNISALSQLLSPNTSCANCQQASSAPSSQDDRTRRSPPPPTSPTSSPDPQQPPDGLAPSHLLTCSFSTPKPG